MCPYAAFVTTAESLGKIPDHTLRGNAMGIFEANVGLWQILARQGEIAAGQAGRVLAGNDQTLHARDFVRRSFSMPDATRWRKSCAATANRAARRMKSWN